MLNRVRIQGKRFLSITFTLTGTIIGAGVLGLPYVFADSGFLVGLAWLIFLGIVMIFVTLCLGEVTLRTATIQQLPGYAEKYLGKFPKKIMVFSMVIGIYAALLAYLIGQGQSLSLLFTGGLENSFYFGVGFWILITAFLQGSLKRLEGVGYFGVSGMILVFFILLLALMPGFSFSNLTPINPSKIFFPFGVILFSLMGFNAIPILRREVGRNKRYLLKKAIIIGILISIIFYLIFSFVFVGVLGREINEVATLSFKGILGGLLLIFGMFTMITSYFFLSYALKDYFLFDLKKRKPILFYVSLVPLMLYLLVSSFNNLGFVGVLGIGGSIAGGITGILILLMTLKSKRKGDMPPEYSMPLNWFLIVLLGIIFLMGILFEFFFLF
ncbi:amino acid permease [Patescibacteria group bacterium]|nr:amino acid permease [Patescibacteria group bacterium]